MCGILTILSPDPADHDLLKPVTNMMAYRGPDNCGLFHDGHVSLGHRRLSVIDLSEAGNQPMQNEDNSLQLVCNGEIYNYRELMDQLKGKGHVFRSKCDSEVLLHLYEEYEDHFLDHVNGMYAFAIWDSREQRLIAAVDRFGKKPLYYCHVGNRLVMASELKCLLCFPWVKREPDPLAIDRYLTLRHVPAPLTIFKHIKKLQMAELMFCQDGCTSIRTYWKPAPNPIDLHNSDPQDSFQALLTDAVKVRLESDVPLGMFLSGGIDSASIAGLMRQLVDGKKISYTVGFDYPYDELSKAQKLADYLNFEHNTLTVTADSFDLLPNIQYHLDEPFGDLLCLPAFLMAREAKKNLTVVLTGDGADEILGGYFHQKLMLLRHKLRGVTACKTCRNITEALVRTTPCSILNSFFDYPDSIRAWERRKLSQAVLASGNFGTFYETVTSCFTARDKSELFTESFNETIPGDPIAAEFERYLDTASSFSLLSRLSLLDIKYWIPFSVIFRLDKMNMAHAIETRSPFLDYRLVEKALNLPPSQKLAGDVNKVVLRNILQKLYPKELIESGKQAFYVPMIDAYRAKHHEWTSRLLSPERITERGLFHIPFVEKLFSESQHHSMLATRQLTSLAMLEEWFSVFVDNDTVRTCLGNSAL